MSDKMMPQSKKSPQTSTPSFSERAGIGLLNLGAKGVGMGTRIVGKAVINRSGLDPESAEYANNFIKSTTNAGEQGVAYATSDKARKDVKNLINNTYGVAKEQLKIFPTYGSSTLAKSGSSATSRSRQRYRQLRRQRTRSYRGGQVSEEETQQILQSDPVTSQVLQSASPEAAQSVVSNPTVSLLIEKVNALKIKAQELAREALNNPDMQQQAMNAKNEADALYSELVSLVSKLKNEAQEYFNKGYNYASSGVKQAMTSLQPYANRLSAAAAPYANEFSADAAKYANRLSAAASPYANKFSADAAKYANKGYEYLSNPWKSSGNISQGGRLHRHKRRHTRKIHKGKKSHKKMSKQGRRSRQRQ